MTFVKQFNDKTDALLEKLKSFSDGKTLVTLFPELNYLTLDAIATVSKAVFYFFDKIIIILLDSF